MYSTGLLNSDYFCVKSDERQIINLSGDFAGLSSLVMNGIQTVAHYPIF